jgi:hypothetical protein
MGDPVAIAVAVHWEGTERWRILCAEGGGSLFRLFSKLAPQSEFFSILSFSFGSSVTISGVESNKIEMEISPSNIGLRHIGKESQEVCYFDHNLFFDCIGRFWIAPSIISKEAAHDMPIQRLATSADAIQKNHSGPDLIISGVDCEANLHK